MGEPLAVLRTRLMSRPLARIATELTLAASMVDWLAFDVSIQAERWVVVTMVVVALLLGLLASGGLRRWNLLVWVASFGTAVPIGALLDTLGDEGASQPEQWLSPPASVGSLLGFGAVFVYPLRRLQPRPAGEVGRPVGRHRVRGLHRRLPGPWRLPRRPPGQWDLVALSESGSASGIARAILLVSSAGAALTTLHSGGLAPRNVLRLSRFRAVALMTTVAAALATTGLSLVCF